MDEIVSMNAANPFAALQRRQVGKREWRVTIQELLESERADLVLLRRMREKYTTDSETQGLVAQLLDSKAERLIKLNELLHYKGEEAPNGHNGNGGHSCG